MDAYILEWFNLLLRWTHLVVGIAWIGSSFYFIWLDANLNRPPHNPEHKGVAGDLWAVHGGGFYHAQKYQLAPDTLPRPLHWFKWEAYTTFLTGFALLVVHYYLNAGIYLVDPGVADISAGRAVVLSLGILVTGWIVYDLLCKSSLDDRGIALVGFLLLIACTYGVFQLFSGRGAYIQIGSMLGTIMVANVFFVIIPGQKELVAAKQRGEEPDPVYGTRGKQRSVHNNYITLPVLLVMLSNHYPMLYAHEYNWLLLIALFVAGVMIRHYFNLRHQGRNVLILPAAALLIIVLMAWAVAPRSPTMDEKTAAAPGVSDSEPATVSFDEVTAIIKQRCVACHAETPEHPTAPVAPNGVMLDTAARIGQWAGRIHERTVVSRTMPPANLTGMTQAERERLERWYRSGAPLK